MLSHLIYLIFSAFGYRPEPFASQAHKVPSTLAFRPLSELDQPQFAEIELGARKLISAITSDPKYTNQAGPLFEKLSQSLLTDLQGQEGEPSPELRAAARKLARFARNSTNANDTPFEILAKAVQIFREKNDHDLLMRHVSGDLQNLVRDIDNSCLDLISERSDGSPLISSLPEFVSIHQVWDLRNPHQRLFKALLDLAAATGGLASALQLTALPFDDETRQCGTQGALGLVYQALLEIEPELEALQRSEGLAEIKALKTTIESLADLKS